MADGYLLSAIRYLLHCCNLSGRHSYNLIETNQREWLLIEVRRDLC
jgi:hypothetical protein